EPAFGRQRRCRLPAPSRADPRDSGDSRGRGRLMDLTHQFVVPASIEETWEAFNDLESIAPCFPGASLTSAEGDEFKGSVKVKLGPIALQYNGSGRFVERDESARRAVIEASGKD